jgi:hypothetical protein
MAAALVKKFPAFIENPKGDDYYKTLHIKM